MSRSVKTGARIAVVVAGWLAGARSALAVPVLVEGFQSATRLPHADTAPLQLSRTPALVAHALCRDPFGRLSGMPNRRDLVLGEMQKVRGPYFTPVLDVVACIPGEWAFPQGRKYLERMGGGPQRPGSTFFPAAREGYRAEALGVSSGKRIPDTDNDGASDDNDPLPHDPFNVLDWDADGLGDLADADDDNDSMPDSYEDLNALNPFSAADAGLDSDLDGMINRDEHVAGTLARDGSSRLQLGILALPTGGVRLVWPGAAGRVYRIPAGPGPDDLDDFSLGEIPADEDGPMHRDVATPGASGRYFRIEARLADQP